MAADKSLAQEWGALLGGFRQAMGKVALLQKIMRVVPFRAQPGII